MTIESFFTQDPLDNYEDPEKYQTHWLPKVEAYRQQLTDAVPEEYKAVIPKKIDAQFNPLNYLYEAKLLSDAELEITESSAIELVAKIARGELSSVEVYKAFAHRATIAHQLTNCALDIFMDEGLERAQFLDDYYKKHGKTIGPLHGLPISLKEQMNYKNRITHGGYVSKITNIPDSHGATTQILENLGAVFYIRTTQPQTLMHLDSNNNFIGVSKNPFNISLSPGGSSSGEGAIVGFGGSAIGIGSDIGGSIRGPAAFSGCIGLRPSTRRVAARGGVSSGAGQESVPAVIGPLTRSVEDIDFWMDTFINSGKPWDYDSWALHMPWRKVEKPKPSDITIAVCYDDLIVKPTPPILRGLKDTVAKLKSAGVKIVEWKPIKTRLADDTVHQLYSCDGNYRQRKLLADSGEPLMKLTKWALNYGDGAREYTVTENRDLNVIRDELRQEYNDFMVANKIDFVLSPTYNNVAPKIEEVYNWSYTSLWNLLDFPSLVFQTGLFVDPKLDQWDMSDYKFRSPVERLELEGWKPESFLNAPIGLQLTGRRYFDEEVVAAGKTIVEILGASCFNKQK